MKKILLVLVIFVLAAGLTGCGIEPEVVDESLAPSSSEESFEAESPPSRPTVSLPDKSSAAVSGESTVEITKEQAVAIAKEYVLKKYNKSFGEYEIEAYEISEYYESFNIKEETWVIAYGSVGGPAVYINKDDGSVIACMLQTPAKTKDQAIAIMKDFIFQKYSDSLDEREYNGTIYRYKIEVWDSSERDWVPEGVWYLSSWLTSGSGYLDVGTPEVIIQKNNGRVVSYR